MYKLIAYFLAPTLRVNLSPQIFTGDSGEDPIELACTATVTEDVMFARYQFKWTKDNAPVISDRIMVGIFTIAM